MKWVRRNKINLIFLLGYIMLAAGVLWFASKGVASVGFYGWQLGFIHIGKVLVVLPFLIGVLWLFLNYESKEAKAIITVGALVILIPVLRSMQYRFQPIAWQLYGIMMLLIFGGLGLIVWAIYLRNKDKQMFKK